MIVTADSDHPAAAFFRSPEAMRARAAELDDRAEQCAREGQARLARANRSAASRLRMLASKPPLGVMPYFIWRVHHATPSLDDVRARLRELDEAVERYRHAGHRVPLDWRQEALDHARTIAGLEAITCPRT